MAKALGNHKLTDSDWSVDDSMRHIARVTGKPAVEAARMLVEGLLAGRLSATAQHSVDGAAAGAGVVPPTFWQDHLTIQMVEGCAAVLPLRALQRGTYNYTLPAHDVRQAWPAAAQAPKALIEAEVMRRVAAGKSYRGITELARSLHSWMQTAGHRPLKVRTIENRLRDWSLWPLPPSK
jgi:hypothetical protein